MKAMRVLSLMVGLAYLVWRAMFTWEGANLPLFLMLLVAEAYGIGRTAVELSLMRGKAKPVSGDTGSEPVGADVVVLALDEPTSEIRAALLSARAVQGCGEVVLVDRDGRPELAELAQRLEIGHVTGSARADVGALLTKAASRGRSSRIVVLPGDVVVMPDITAVTASSFEDPEVAVVLGQVQATNASHEIDYDGYGQNRVRDEVITPSLDADHALPWWTEVSVLRREALEEIGGFAPDRRSVNLATGIRLQVGGWRVADNRVVVGRRLVSWSDERHLHRWSRELHDRLSLLRRPDVSWSSTRITPRMRLAYYSALIDGTRSVQRLLLIVVLLAALAGVGMPVSGPDTVLVAAWAGQMGLRLVARWLAARPTRPHVWIAADIRLLSTELIVGWRVLRRRRVDEELHDPAPGLRMRGVLLWALQIALPVGVAVNTLGIRRAPYDDPAMAAMLAVAVWLWFVALQARASLKLRQVRQSYRATEDLDVLNSNAGLAVVGVSPFGIDVVSKPKLQVGDRLRLAFALPGADGSVSRMEVATVVRRSRRDGKHHIGYLRFSLISDEEMDRVIEYCAVVAGHREMRDVTVSLSAELVTPASNESYGDPVVAEQDAFDGNHTESGGGDWLVAATGVVASSETADRGGNESAERSLAGIGRPQPDDE